MQTPFPMLVGAIALIISALAWADQPAVNQRQQLFDQLDTKTELMEDALDQEQWQRGAELAAELADTVTLLKTLFPETSRGEGRSRKSIWNEWPEFEGRLTRLADDFTAISNTAESGRSAGLDTALKNATSSCRSCHMSYRSLW